MNHNATAADLLSRSAPSTDGYGAFLFWPENLVWSNQLNRLIGYASLGAADFSEIWSVACRLPVGDAAAWEKNFCELAAVIDAEAIDAEKAGHVVTATEKWSRATTYYRFASQLAAFRGTRGKSVTESLRCFLKATSRSELRVDPTDVPFQDKALAGYLIRPRGTTGARPAVIVSGGIDTYAEEMYYKIGLSLGRRGYVVLLLDGPGQGESARRGINGRHPYETACAAAIDYLSALPDVDARRVAMVGQSLGGYFATRAAAFERRLAACAIWGATGNFFAQVGANATADSPLMSQLGQMEAYFGVRGVDAVREWLRGMTLDGVPERIRCPTLILHGELDAQIPVEAARWTYDHIISAPKRLVIVPAGKPGATHCQLDAPVVAQHILCDFLDEELGSS
ncbi:MAG TPA: alpha/beta fold hydrolase [Polyangiaceae bacterium]|nr:alpha/beta fold hydrolase [Polyangiaceae bacterium]